MKEKQNREAKLPSKLLTSKQTPRPRLGRCPHLQNLTAKLRKTQKSGKSRSSPRPTYPKAHRREEAVPLPLLHYELQQSSKKGEKVHYKARK
jgi:hypothetical protein